MFSFSHSSLSIFITENMYALPRGHGTYVEDEQLRASVAGVVERVNKLICVRPFKSR
jgi:exosome complex RNA-binding protein Rrp4